MSEDQDKGILQFPQQQGLVDAKGNPIAPPVDDELKAEIDLALQDPYVRKLTMTIVTVYQMYAAARHLLETDTEYSLAAKQGLIAATFHNLFDPDTHLCRPFQFPKVRKRLRDQIIPFTAQMAMNFTAQQDKYKQDIVDADEALRDTPIPFFKEMGELERGEVYVLWAKPDERDKVLQLINAWSAKTAIGLLWLSRHKGDSEEFKELMEQSRQEANIAPAEVSKGSFSARRNTILSLPLMHLYVSDGKNALGTKEPDDKAMGRFKAGLAEKKSTGLIVLCDKDKWDCEVGIRVGVELSKDPDADLEDSMIVRKTP